MSEQTNKEKILIVLKESIKLGRESEFVYYDMYEKHKEVLMINNLNKTIKEKIDLFNNMNEDSNLFATIYDCAKLAHSNMLEKQRYNYFSAELIMKFNSLEEIFKRRLKPIGIHINSDLKPKNIEKPVAVITEVDEEENEPMSEEMVFEPLRKHARYIEQGLTGEEMLRRKQKETELIDVLRSAKFE